MDSGPPPFRQTVASVLLDALRGIAALLVCIDHWRHLFFLDYSQLSHHRGLLLVPYAITGLGHQAVVIFFVLSGYLVGGHVLRARDTWSWRDYMLQRGVRLWIVLLPALFLGGLVDLTAIHFHLAPALYAGQVDNHITFDVSRTLTWKALAGNCFFLQTILVPVFGSNGPLWSLANEFWYYLIFPLGLFAVRGRYPIWKRLVMGGLCAGILYGVGSGIALSMVEWLLGVLLAVLPVRRTAAWMRWLAVAVCCPVFMLTDKVDLFRWLPADYAVGLLTAGLLYIFLGAKEVATGKWYEGISREIAGFSYTLYLVHVPMLMLLTALLAGETRWVPGLHPLVIASPALVFAIAYAYLVARVTEFRTAEVRDWVRRLLIRQKVLVVAPK